MQASFCHGPKATNHISFSSTLIRICPKEPSYVGPRYCSHDRSALVKTALAVSGHNHKGCWGFPKMRSPCEARVGLVPENQVPMLEKLEKVEKACYQDLKEAPRGEPCLVLLSPGSAQEL